MPDRRNIAVARQLVTTTVLSWSLVFDASSVFAQKATARNRVTVRDVGRPIAQDPKQVIAASVFTVKGLTFPKVQSPAASANKTAVQSCCQAGETRTNAKVAAIDLVTPKDLPKGEYRPESGYHEVVYSPPLSCWVISSYTRTVTDANGGYEATDDAQPATFSYTTKTQYESTLNELKNYVVKLNLSGQTKADLNAKLDEFVKSYSSYANSISTSHGQVRHKARVEGQGWWYQGRSWYHAHITTDEICCPPEVRDAGALRQTLTAWVDQTVAKLSPYNTGWTVNDYKPVP